MPHCPVCGLEPAEGRSRCPVDNAFLHSLYCPDCGGEIGWRDLYCGNCGRPAEKGLRRETVPLDSASFSRVAAAFMVDGLVVLAMAPVLFSFVPEIHSLGSLPICLPFLWFYLVILWSGGRQSLGQFIFRLVALNEQRLPISVAQLAFRLSLGFFSPKSGTRLMLWQLREPGQSSP